MAPKKKPEALKIMIKYHDKDLGKIEKIPVGDWIDLRSAERVDMDAGQFRIISLGVSMKLPEGYDTKELFKMAIEQSVAFVIGEAFHCDESGKNTMRLNFSFMDDANIEEGIKRLAVAIKKLFESKQ